MSASKTSGEMRKPETPGDARKAPRKPYVSPKLQVYGSVAKLTRGGNGSGGDGGLVGMRKGCL